MPILTLADIAKSYGTQVLFEDASFFINERERVALVGANGTGKTTLLRIILGEEPPDFGTVTREAGITIGYLPQEVDLPDTAELHLAVMGVTPELQSCAIELNALEKRIAGAEGRPSRELAESYAEVQHWFDTLHGYEYRIEAKAILLGLGFDQPDLCKPIQTLSGGQKTRAALARLLLLSPDVLLLDEPTNHLDIQACEWLQTFMRDKFRGAAFIVSHDRYFLDRVVSRVIEIENQRLTIWPGDYSAFARQKAARIEEQRKLYKLQQKEIARIEKAIQTLFSDRKFSRRDSKIKQLERIERLGPVWEQETISARLSPAVRSGQEVLRLDGLSKSYPGKPLFSDLDVVFERGTKIGIVGPNGSGKTTLLKIISGVEKADSGNVVFGVKVHPVYFAQQFDHLVPSRTVLEELLADADLTSGQARDLLAQFLFQGDDAFKKVEVLSGGEMCRLALAKVLATGPNLLLLDEPTNHLDIPSREALEDALRRFDGTMLVASHDRYLLDAIAEGILEIKDGAWAHYLGGYSDYREKTQPAPKAVPAVPKPKKNVPPPPRAKRPDSPLKAQQRLLRQLENRRSELEFLIEQAEARLRELSEMLADPGTYKDAGARRIADEHTELSARLEEMVGEWERVCGEIGSVSEGIAAL